MTILKKRKGLLYLIIAIAIMVLAIACGDKPTQTSDFAEIDNNLPWSTNTTDSGDTFTAKNIADASADSPVIVISGNNLILAYGKNNKVYYRSSHDLGETLTTETEFGTEHERSTPTTKKYPHIFFNGDNVIAVATARGRVVELGQPLVYITGTFKMSDNGVGYIGFNKWGTIGVINFEGQSGEAGGGLKAEKYFNKETTIQTAAGVGRIVNGKYLLPISETSGTKYLKLEAKQYDNAEFGAVWDLNGDNTGTKTANIIVKLDENGNKLDEGIAEKAGSYSIAANGTITGITGSPQVGNGTTEASIAEDGNGTIYTFTKEADGLVFRKFANTISGAIK